MLFDQMKMLLNRICCAEGVNKHDTAACVKALDDYVKLGSDPIVPTKRSIDCLIGLSGKFIEEGKYYPVEMKENDFSFSFEDDEKDFKDVQNQDEYFYVDGEKFSMAIESKWGIVDYTILPFDNRRLHSAIDNIVNDIGLHEALEDHREVINKLFEKFKDENNESYIVLAFSFHSYRGYCDEYEYVTNIEGLYNFKLGCVVKIPN